MPLFVQPLQVLCLAAPFRALLLGAVQCACFFAFQLPATAQFDRIEITADSVNLRACPASECEVATQVSTGDVLQSRGPQRDDWLEVVPPTGTVFWVYAELVQGDRAVVDSLRVRCGPGINYRAVDKLSKGTAVTPLGREGDWLRIAPTPDASLWVSALYARRLVDAAELSVGVPAESPAVTAPIEAPRALLPTGGQAEVDRRTARRAVSPVPSGEVRREPESVLKVSAADVQSVRYEGTITSTGLTIWRRPSRFRLVQADPLGRIITRCYIVGDEKRLAAHDGKEVVMVGQQTWLSGVRYPVVTLESLAPLR